MATACKNDLNTDKYLTKDGLASVMIKQRLLDNFQKEVRWFEERWRKSISKLTTSIELFKYKTNKNANSHVGTSIVEEKIAWGQINKPVSTFNKNDLKFYIIENTLPSSVAMPPTVILKQLGENLQIQLSKLTELKNRRLQNKNKHGLIEQCEKHTIIEIKHSIIKYYKEKYDNLIEYSKTNKHFLKQYTRLEYKGDNNKLTSYDQCSEQNILSDKMNKSKISLVHKDVTPCSKNYVDAEIRDSKALDKEKVLFSRQEPAERDTVEKKKQRDKQKRCKNNLNKNEINIMTPSQIIDKMNNDRNALLQNIFAHKLLVKQESRSNKHHLKGQVNKNCHRNCLVEVKDVSSKQISKKTIQSKGINSKQNQSTINKTNGEGSNKATEKKTKKLHHSTERSGNEVKKKSSKQHKSDRVHDHKKKKKRHSNRDKSRRKTNDEMKEMLASPYMALADKRAFLAANRAQQRKPVNEPKPVNDSADKHLRLVNKLYNDYSSTKKLVLEEEEEEDEDKNITENGTKTKETVRKSVYQENQHSKSDTPQKPNHSTLTNKRVCYIQLQNHDQEIEKNRKTSRSVKDCKNSDRKLGGLYRSVETLIFRNNNISNFDLNTEVNDHKLGKPVWLDPDPRPNGFGPLKPRPHATYQKPLKPRTVIQEFVQFLGDPNANLYSIGCL